MNRSPRCSTQVSCPVLRNYRGFSPATIRFAAAAIRGWLALGLLALAVLPAAREISPLLGWMPFWLLAAPLLVLAQVEAINGFRGSTRLWARSRMIVQRSGRRAQARRLPRPRISISR